MHSNHTSVNDFKWSCAESVQQSLVSKKKFKILVDLYRFRIVSQFSIRFQLRDGAGRSDCDSFSSDFVVWDVILDAFLIKFLIPGGSLRFPEVP